jgi:drug/metabolite transporter (DMT)-like permease
LSTGIEFALGAMLFFGLGDLVYKRAAMAGVQAHHFLMMQSWGFAASVALYGALTGTLHFVAGSLWGLLAGLFMFTGFYNFAASLHGGSISINAPIFRLSFVLTAALAIALLGELLTPAKSAGIALALAAAWLLLGGGADGDDAKRETLSSLARVIVATVAVGIGNFVYSLGLRAGATPASIIVCQAAVVVSCSTLLVRIADGRIRPSGPVVRHAPRASVVLALAFVFMVEAMARGQASIAVPIAQMGFVVTALLGFVFLRERFTVRKGVGIAAALAALASLAFAQWAVAGDLGVVLLHGKGGSPTGYIRGLADALQAKGYPVAAPAFAWSKDRIYDASFEAAMLEIDQAAQELRQKGAKSIVVAGHSLGANVALGYAARREGLAGVIALAPAHSPESANFARRLSGEVSRARDLVAAGRGKERLRFGDLNQGQSVAVNATPEIYLSWMDPDGAAVMPRSAAAFKASTPLLVVNGQFDRSSRGPDYFFDKAPPHPKSKFVVVSSDHFDVPAAAVDVVESWLAGLGPQ